MTLVCKKRGSVLAFSLSALSQVVEFECVAQFIYNLHTKSNQLQEKMKFSCFILCIKAVSVLNLTYYRTPS